MIILIHSSKTMRPAEADNTAVLSTPILLDKAKGLAYYLKTLSVAEIENTMRVSPVLASTTKGLISEWTVDPKQQRAAVDSFLGDIYSGLQVANWNKEDRQYANDHLRILSGIYGILKPFDGIYPYRFEMGYRVPDQKYRDLYKYWGTSIIDTLPKNVPIIDLSAVEYGKTVTDFVETVKNDMKIIAPKFLTISPKTGEPVFVVVHAKIARGAFASWVIRNQIENVAKLKEFNEIGYEYNETMSTDKRPVFVARVFKGLGLSIRLT